MIRIMENSVQNFIQVQFTSRTPRIMFILRDCCGFSQYFKIPKCLKLSRMELGEKCLTLFYLMIKLATFLKLIPFQVVEIKGNGVNPVETNNINDNNYNQLNGDPDPDSVSETKNGPFFESILERRFEKFTKSWQLRLYYFLTVIFYILNIYKWHFFLKPMIVSFQSNPVPGGDQDESEKDSNVIIPGNYHRHLEVDIYFSGHAIFVVASSFALILKTTLLFSVDDLIILLNDVERTQRYFQKDHQLQMRRNMNSAVKKFQGSRFSSSVKLTMIHQKKKKSAWYYSAEGILAIIGAFYASYSAHVLISIVSTFEFRLKVYKDQPVDFVQISLLMAQISCAFIDLTLCIVSVYFLIVIIVTFKIQLKDFDKHATFHSVHNKGKYEFSSRLEQFLIYYRHLQLVNVYANGYLRYIYFPFYVVSMTFGLLVFTYVSLTAYEYLPIIIYLFFPGLSLFVFIVMIIVALSQVANIHRLSQQVQNRISSHRGFSLEFEPERRQSQNPNQDDPSSTSSSTMAERLTLIERMKIIGKQQVKELQRRERVVRAVRYSETAYLQRTMRTIRPFGFQFGNLGLITIDTPNLMILTACNYLLVILS